MSESKPKIGITGANGFIGKHFLEKFLKDGFVVNAYVRNAKTIDSFSQEGTHLNVFEGDIADKDKLAEFVKESDVIVHLAAGTKGRWEDYYNATVLGSTILLELCEKHNVKKLIYMSSIGNYDIFARGVRRGLKEDTPLEPYLDLRGWYAKTKESAFDNNFFVDPRPVITAT